MTRNRKAELQRKLAMAPAATPPAGLADRIKSDIPRSLGFSPESERTNLRKSATFNLRIAASVILLVSSLYLVLHLLSRRELNSQPTMMAERAFTPAQPRPAAALPNTPPEPGSARLQTRSDLPALPSGPPPTSIAAAPPRGRIADARRAEADGMTVSEPTYVSSVEPQPAKIEPPAAKTESITVAAAAPALDYAPPPPVSAPQAAPAQAAEGLAATALEQKDKDTDRVAKKAMRENNRDAPAVRNFVAIQQALARGETPRDNDAAAILQHFAAPERVPAGLHVELEASATPLDATKWLLRVSVDAPASTATAIDLEFGDAVALHHALAGSPAPNTTALYEIEFKPDTKRDQIIATVRAGRAVSTVRVADLHPWNAASPRMKRASLASAWTRTLQSRAQIDAIVAKAREAHIDELVDMAESAAARIR